MANTTITPNMGLILPTVGEDPGPDWATNLNASLAAVDSHDHASGSGVSITPAGININSDLPMNNSNLTMVRTVRFNPQVTIPGNAADIGCLTEVGVDLYYIDGSGNQIRITQSGSVSGSAGTITGLPSGTASAAFAAGTFTFQKSTGTPASMNVGSVKIGQEVASGYGVTISAAVGQAANYNMGLPAALPASTKFLTIDASGNIGDTYDVDNSSIEVSSSLLRVKALGVTNSMLAPVNYGVSSDTGFSFITSTSYGDVPNANFTITTVGRPVIITLTANDPEAGIGFNGGAGDFGYFRLQRNGVAILSTLLGVGASTGAGRAYFGPSTVTFFDVPAAGTYDYTLQAKVDSGAALTVKNCQLLVREL